MSKGGLQEVGSEIVSFYENFQTFGSPHGLPLEANSGALPGSQRTYYNILSINFAMQGGSCSVS
jgi:hypothetical protein